ncbi:ABC transporter ATP-binding protein [Gracilibacillus salinarum]|uniref:ABC transporter ATP-binding protein n=1 Tax=Gracilibacillus salinarum TaxID=2932255 RepID=A0ABY4GKW1_9BACI|nr:ABC transporter ATP-binding protein [Gracilibacillus salinarum]UOQ84082.1 ABC transporter ATP-binding protein [Gracilibacillus salinarum]
MTIVKADQLSKKYPSKQALAPISFEISTGECLVLCGGNGAGKSTLIHLLAALSKPTTGTVVLDSTIPLKNRQAYVEHIGYMPDEFPSQLGMTVQEMLEFYAAYRPAASKAQVSFILNKIGLFDQRTTFITSLSKGMRQRLLFGQALLGEPRLLLMDEPTNGLDPYWINEFLAIVKEMQAAGTSIIFSTHMMDVAADAGDTVLFMKEGKVIQEFQHINNKKKTTLDLLQLHRNA